MTSKLRSRVAFSRPLLLALSAILLLAREPAAQCVIVEIQGTADYDFLGMWVDGGADVDGDGTPDFVAAALGYSQGGRAEVYSGRSATLLFTIPAPQVSSCALVGDVDGDGRADIAVGESSFASSAGRVRVYSGLTGGLVYTLTGASANDYFGSTVAGAGDVSGDGRADFIVGAPQLASQNPGPGYARVFSGANGTLLHQFVGLTPGDGFGYSVAGAGYVDADARADLIVGAWLNDLAGTDAGMARVYSGANGQILHHFVGSAAQDGFGTSVAGAGDVNGDGRSDLIVGAPGDDTGGSYAGAARVFSGASGTPLHVFLGAPPIYGLGSNVAGAGDVDGDTRPDVIVNNSGGNSSARVYSGATGSLIVAIDGINLASVAGAGDIDGDGLAEILIGDPIEPGPEVGTVRIHVGPGAAPAAHCTAKINSQGCTPQVSSNGTPTSSGTDPFLISASQVINNKNGIMFYGLSGRASQPFQGGTLCASQPLVRTPVQSSGGNPPPDDCSGVFSFDFNAWIQSGTHPQLVPGRRVDAQFWYRDPPASFGTGLSDAIGFTICI